MKKLLLLLVFVTPYLGSSQLNSKLKTIHVFVALCDNINQGIVPVSSKLGNGQDPRNNLYWVAMYGVKSYFKRNKDWVLISSKMNLKRNILERVLFKHNSEGVYLLADAYDGKYIRETTIDFLEASAGNNIDNVSYNNLNLNFGGGSNLVAYIGHDGLMEFDVTGNFKSYAKNKPAAIILACVSKSYFRPYLERTKVIPLV